MIASDFTQLPPLIIVVVLAIVGAFHWFAIHDHKKQIAQEVQRLKGQLIRTKWLPFYSFTDKNDTFYEVTLKLPSGKQFTAICKCNMLHGVYWKSTPWSQSLTREFAKPTGTKSDEPQSTDAVDDGDFSCRKCGFTVKSTWSVCPNCATPIEGS